MNSSNDIIGAEFYGEDEIYAIVIRHNFSVSGIHFFSPSSFSQQLGLMKRPSGYRVPTHRHNPVSRTILNTQEVLMIRSGECQVKLFDDLGRVIHTVNLFTGDVILLAKGAHEVFMVTECDILEVKQGPYVGKEDKTLL